MALQPQSGRTESSTVWTLELRRCCCDSVCFVVTGNGKALASFISLLQTLLQPFGTSCAVPPCCWRYFHKRFLGCLFCSAPSCSEACLFFGDEHCRQTTQTCPRCGGRGHGGEGCSAPLSRPNCSGPHSAAWLGYPEYRTYLLANKIKAQTYMLHNYAIRQAKQISHNHTDNTGNKRITRTVPHTSQSDYTQNQPQTATQKTQLRKHG